MALPIDQLQIDIKAQSKSAVSEINALTGSLTQLKSAVRGGVGLNTVATQFEKFSKAVNSMTAPSAKIVELVNALKPLQGIGKSNLGTALNQLKKIPEITKGLDSTKLAEFSAKIQQVTLAVRPLANEMNKVSMGFSKLPANIQKAINANARLTKSNTHTAFGFNMLVAKIGIYVMILRRVAGVIAGWIKESNDYVENLNLFHVAMGKYADEAQAYAEKVSGILGIDPSQFMRYQAVFQNMATGFGIAGDRAAIMSKNLTQLGYDLASVFNVQFDVAMEKLQSGLSGQPRPMREWGFDLSEATLKAVALKKGIDKNVESMTQFEKSQLRYVQLLETAQRLNLTGDLARTLEAPANQLRILKAQAVQASRALGNIFIPALNAVLPYAIAFLRVIRWVAQEIANLFGFALPEIDYSGLGEVVGGADDLAEGMDNANGAAKELKKTILGFDQLNLMTDPTAGGSGKDGVGGGGINLPLPEYDFLGGLLDSKADGIFNKWKEQAEPTLNFIKDNFETIKQIAIGIGIILLGWKVGTGLGAFIEGLTKLPMLLGGIGLILGGGFLEGSSIKSIIEEGLNSLNFSGAIGGGGALAAGVAMLGKALGKALLGGAIGGIVAGVPLFVTGVYDALKNGISVLSALLIAAGATAAGAGIGAIIGMLGGPIGAGLGALIGLAVGAITDVTIWVVQNWETVKEKFSGAAKWVDNTILKPIKDLFKSLSSWFKEKVVDPVAKVFEPITSRIGAYWKGLWIIVQAVWKVASTWFFNNVISPISNMFNGLKTILTTVFASVSDYIKLLWGSISGWFSAHVISPVVAAFSTAWSTIRTAFETAFRGISSFAKTIFNNVLGSIQSLINKVIGSANKLIDGFNTVAKGAARIIGTDYGGIARIKPVEISLMASGGYALPGEMFIAREDGPEMVGTMSGKTAVASNDQIVAGIEAGVYRAVTQAMSQSQGSDHFVVNVGGKTVLDTVITEAQRRNARSGRNVVSVGVN